MLYTIPTYFTKIRKTADGSITPKIFTKRFSRSVKTHKDYRWRFNPKQRAKTALNSALLVRSWTKNASNVGHYVPYVYFPSQYFSAWMRCGVLLKSLIFARLIYTSKICNSIPTIELSLNPHSRIPRKNLT